MHDVLGIKGKALPRLVPAIWFSLGWCIVQQGDRQGGFTNSLGVTTYEMTDEQEPKVATRIGLAQREEG
jgi:predicted component of type VI protein secretion system